MHAQSSSTLGDFMDCSLPGSSVHEIFQARNTGVGVISRTTGSFQHRDLTHISCMGRRILYHCAPWEACKGNVWFVHTHTNTHTHAHMGVGVHAHTHTHTRWNIYLSPIFIYLLFIPEKEGNPAVCNNMNEPGGYFNQWNEPVTEGKMLHDCTYMRY